MFKIVMIDGLYNVEYNGTIIDTFYSKVDAEDFIICTANEMELAWQDVGCEFDEPWLD